MAVKRKTAASQADEMAEFVREQMAAGNAVMIVAVHRAEDQLKAITKATPASPLAPMLAADRLLNWAASGLREQARECPGCRATLLQVEGARAALGLEQPKGHLHG